MGRQYEWIDVNGRRWPTLKAIKARDDVEDLLDAFVRLIKMESGEREAVAAAIRDKAKQEHEEIVSEVRDWTR